MTQSNKNLNLECDLHFAHLEGHTDFDYIPGEK